MSEQINETLELVKEAQKQGVFNLSDVIKGRGYPHKSVTIYVDAEAAFELIKLETQLTGTPVEDPRYDELKAEIDSCAKKVTDSKLVFHMRGVSQTVVEEAEAAASEAFPDQPEEERSDAWFRYYMAYLIASNIEKVENANGDIDERKFTVADVVEIRNLVPVDSWAILVSTMQQLTLASGYFRGLTDAGFLPKS